MISTTCSACFQNPVFGLGLHLNLVNLVTFSFYTSSKSKDTCNKYWEPVLPVVDVFNHLNVQGEYKKYNIIGSF